jgi:hypothetical protein
MGMFGFKIEKNRRFLVIAGAVLLLMAVVYRLLPMFQDMGGRGEAIALKQRQLEKYRQMVHEGDDLEKKPKSLKKILRQGESGLLTGKTPSLAAADIQNILHDMAGQSHVEIKTVRVLKPETLGQGDYVGVPVQFTVTSTIGPLKEFLYRIETSPKYLTVKKVKIMVPSRGRLKGIRSDITVYGFLKREGK